MPKRNLPTLLYISGIFLILAVLPTAYLYGQERQQSKEATWDNTIETDGPDFTEASSVIPKGTIQVESTAMFFKDTENGQDIKTYIYPNTLVRIGILESAELRIIGEYTDIRTGPKVGENEIKTAGMAPLIVGTKLFICEEKGLRPQASFIGHVLLPTGSRAYRPQFSAAQFRFSLSNTLSEKFELGYNIGYEWDGFSPRGQGIYTLALGYSATKRWGLYAEIFGDKPEGEPLVNALAGGVKYLIAPNWQVDISGGTGLNTDSFDYYMAYGLRFRLPY